MTDRSGLTREETERYSRHLLIPEVGREGQLALKRARVLVVGTGGLGSPVSLYLAAAGVGTLGLVDFDLVDASNLQRQILHATRDVGRKKTDSARESLHDVNPNVRIECFESRLTASNALEILGSFDIVIDGTDNFPTRYLVNDACVLLNKPNVYGSIFRFEGQASVFDPGAKGPCYRCLFAEPPPPGTVPSCAEGGVLGILPGVIGMIQATEAIKLILGAGESLVGRLLLFNALEMRFQELNLRRDARCAVCGDEPTVTELIDYEGFCGLRTPEPSDSGITEISPRELRERVHSGKSLVLIDVRESSEADICQIPGAQLIPLGEFPQGAEALDRSAPIVVYCKKGVRGQKAARLLTDAGFESVENLRGGILAWADEVDPEMPRY